MKEYEEEQLRRQPRITDVFETLPNQPRMRLVSVTPVTNQRPMVQTDLRELLFHRRHTRFRTPE